jgi:nicotinate-nucleotide adenylyltransferase
MRLEAKISEAAALNQAKQQLFMQEYHEDRRLNRVYRLGIMGGTFDPIHYGHLVTAESARWEFKLDRVMFVPSGQPPHKPAAGVSDPEHRYCLTLLATASNPGFLVSRIEIDRPGASYAVDTVKQVFKELGDPLDLYFITGADAVLEISTWRDVPELFSRCTFVAATRPGFDLRELPAGLSLPRDVKDKIRFLEVPMLAISSTDIRQRVQAGKPVRYLLPESVEEYIEQHQLYQSPNS